MQWNTRNLGGSTGSTAAAVWLSLVVAVAFCMTTVISTSIVMAEQPVVPETSRQFQFFLGGEPARIAMGPPMPPTPPPHLMAAPGDRPAMPPGTGPHKRKRNRKVPPTRPTPDPEMVSYMEAISSLRDDDSNKRLETLFGGSSEEEIEALKRQQERDKKSGFRRNGNKRPQKPSTSTTGVSSSNGGSGSGKKKKTRQQRFGLKVNYPNHPLDKYNQPIPTDPTIEHASYAQLQAMHQELSSSQPEYSISLTNFSFWSILKLLKDIFIRIFCLFNHSHLGCQRHYQGHGSLFDNDPFFNRIHS